MYQIFLINVFQHLLNTIKIDVAFFFFKERQLSANVLIGIHSEHPTDVEEDAFEHQCCSRRRHVYRQQELRGGGCVRTERHDKAESAPRATLSGRTPVIRAPPFPVPVPPVSHRSPTAGLHCVPQQRTPEAESSKLPVGQDHGRYRVAPFPVRWCWGHQ